MKKSGRVLKKQREVGSLSSGVWGVGSFSLRGIKEKKKNRVVQ